jgi:hypothetical protein
MGLLRRFRLLVPIGIALGCVAPGSAALAVPQLPFPSPSPALYHGAVTLINSTEDITLSYDLRWGPNGPWQRIVLGPGQSFNHHWDGRVAFQPEIRFGAGIYRPGPVRRLRLNAYAAVGPEDPGKRYDFYVDGRGYLSLEAVN